MTQEEIKRFKLPKVRVKYPTPWGIVSYKGSVDLPQSWRNGSNSSFRILEWACPLYSGYQRFGIFECSQESIEIRNKQVYLWKQGDSKLIIIARPESITSAQPLLRNDNENDDHFNKRNHGHKTSGNKYTSYYKDNGYILQRYHYRGDCQSLKNDNRFVEAGDFKLNYVDANNNNYSGIEHKDGRPDGENKITDNPEKDCLEPEKSEFSMVKVSIIPRRNQRRLGYFIK